jgi:hypothetical protein
MITTTDSITDKARMVLSLEQAMATIKAQLDEAKADLMAMVQEGSVDTDVARITVVAPTTRTVDLVTLKAALGPRRFHQVTRPAIDWKSFDILQSLGRIPTEAKHLIEVRPGTRYVKVTSK